MSWQQYIDKLFEGNHIVGAVIYGANGSTWASSAELKTSEAESKCLCCNFDDPTKFLPTGVHVCGEKYMCIRAEENRAYFRIGPKGCIWRKTKLAIIVAFTAEDEKFKPAAGVVEHLADQLEEADY